MQGDAWVEMRWCGEGAPSRGSDMGKGPLQEGTLFLPWHLSSAFLTPSAFCPLHPPPSQEGIWS